MQRRVGRSRDAVPLRKAVMATRSHSGATLGIEETLWHTADKMRGHMVALGLISLKYISDASEEPCEESLRE